MRLSAAATVAVMVTTVVAIVLVACARPTPQPGAGPDQPSAPALDAGQPASPLAIVTVAEAVADVLRHLAPEAEVIALAAGDPAVFAAGPDDQARASSAAIVVARESELAALGVEDRPRPGPGNMGDGGPIAVALPGEAAYPWLDPAWVQGLLPTLRLALTSQDQAGAEAYESAATRLQLELVGLADMETVSLAAIPDERMSFAVDAPETVASLATRLGLTVVALADGVETVAQAEAMSDEDLAAAIAASSAPMVYLAAPGNHARVAELASASGRPLGLLFAVNPSADDGPAPGYLGMMRFNVRSLFEGLSPPDGTADGIPAAGTEESAEPADANSTSAPEGTNTREPTDVQVTPETPAPPTAPLPTLGAAGL